MQRVFAARLTSLDESARGGPELDDPSRGGYATERIDLLGDGLASVDLRPVTYNQLDTMYPGPVWWYEAHPFRAALWGVAAVLVGAATASALLAR